MDLFTKDGAKVKLFATDTEELKQLMRQVMFDSLPPAGKADLAYCMALTVDAQPSVLDVTANLWCAGHVPSVGVCRGTTKHGYAGYAFCEAGLIKRGVRREDIIPVDLLPVDGENLNSYTEVVALRSAAIKSGWRRIFVSSAFFHQMRASSTMVSVLDPYDQVRIYNQPAEPPSWHDRIRHSQGVLVGTLYELLIEEIWRLFRYHADGYLRSCREILDYYDRRDFP